MLSFYKIFGYPTGIGCLLVKKTKFNILKKPWFAGGTITLSAVKYNSFFLKPNHESFEDGTINYLDIPAIINGLNFITEIGIENISKRIEELSLYVISELTKLKHDNGQSLIRLYGPKANINRGGTFLLNLLDINGQVLSITYIERLATIQMISFRTGCFCNPGIDELNHSISSDQLKNYFVSREHGDYFDFIDFIGRMRGAIRISIGFPTTRLDIKKFIDFAKTFLNRSI